MAVVAAGGAFAVVRSSGDDADARPKLTRVEADLAAARACRAFDRFEQLVEDNASGNKVYDAIDEAKESAEQAADANPRWRSLASGTDAVRVGFRNDDAGAARLGIDIVRAQCRLNR